MKTIKEMIKFIKMSKSFMEMPIWKLILFKGAIKKAIGFVKIGRKHDAMVKQYGSDMAYALMDRTLVIEV